MTSQEKIENQQLIEDAKKLGIKSPHMYSLDKLKQAVADATGSEKAANPVEEDAPEAVPVRSKVPKMSVENITENSRERVASEWRKKEPDCEFVYQRSDVTASELEQKGLQWTGVRVKGEILCRTDKQGYNEVQSAKRDAEAKRMERIDPKNSRVARRLTEMHKTPEGVSD